MASRVLKIVSLCAGVGGFDLGLEHALGRARTVLQVEQNPYCRAVLERQFPDAARSEDVTAAVPRGLDCDVLAAGFPYQSHSTAGARKGIDDHRWLWPDVVRWARELRPMLVAIENVMGLLTSSKGEAFSAILRDLDLLGYDARWRVIAASDVQAPHSRKRVVLMAYRRDLGAISLGKPATPSWGHPGWPSRPSEPQRDYEPPRVAAKSMNRRHRLHAIGNAMVPHVAYAAGLWARHALEGHWGGVLGKVVVAFSGGRRAARQEGLFDRGPEAPCPRWPKHGAMVGGVVRTLPSTAIDERAKGLWPSPNAKASNDGEGVATWEARRDALKAKGINGNGAGMPLTIAVQKDWVSQQAGDSKVIGDETTFAKREAAAAAGTGGRQAFLSHQAMASSSLADDDGNWPTPRASESEMRTYAPTPTHGGSHGRQLQAEVIALDGDPTAPAPGEKRPDIGALNPDWAEILMGFAPGWTQLDVDMTKKARKAARTAPAAARRKKTTASTQEGT